MRNKVEASSIKRFNYRGFVVNFEDDSFKLYTRDEWSYGKGYRYPEWEADNEDEAREWIDSYHMDESVLVPKAAKKLEAITPSNQYCKEYNIGDAVRFVHSGGRLSKEVAVIKGYDKDGFYVVEWEDGEKSKGIADINLKLSDYDSSDEDPYYDPEDQFEATNPGSIGQHKRSSFDIIDVTNEEDDNFKMSKTDIDFTLEDEEENDEFGRTKKNPHGYLPYI